METSFTTTDKKIVYASTDDAAMIRHLRKIIAAAPDEVTVLAEPETNDGCLYVKFPAKYLTVRMPRKREYTEEEKKTLRDRMLMARRRKEETET